MGVRRYEDLECWQLSNELKRRVYAVITRPQVRRDFEFCDQIRRSARSAPRNTAEGFGRFRPAEFAQYLRIAKGSLVETHNHLRDALDCGYVSEEEYRELKHLAERATSATAGLIQYLGGCDGAAFK